MPPKKKKVAQRVLVDGLTEDQDELLRTVQYRQGMLAGRDSLYLARGNGTIVPLPLLPAAKN